VLLLPGVRANRLSMVDRAKFIYRAGYSVLLIDFQATGETKGRGITFGWLESRDVLAAVDFLRMLQPGTRIGILGSSLGGAAALLSAPPLRVDALILEAVYPTISRAIDNRLTNYMGPMGRLATPLLLAQTRFRIGVSAARLRPVDHIGQVVCPVFVMNGSEDHRTTRADAVLLYSRARAPKSLWIVPRAGHVDLHRVAPAEYEPRVLIFLAGALRRRAV